MLFLSFLPPDQKKYLLKWAGGVDKHSCKEEDYGLKLIFSPFCSDENDLPDLSSGQNRFNYYIKHENIVVEALFGLLPYLPIGSVWQNRKLVQSTTQFQTQKFHFNYTSDNYKNFSFNESISHQVKGREVTNKIIPSEFWSFGGGNLDKAGQISGLHCIEVEPNLEVLIPHYEIIRNFYCDSTRTAILFAEGHLANDEKYLFDRSLSYLDPFNVGELHLSKHAFIRDAKMLGQYAFSEEITKRAINARLQLMFGSGLNNTSQGLDNLNCKNLTKLPVDGRYVLKANGLWVHVNDSLVKRFLITNIIELDYDLPYSRLRVHKNTYDYTSVKGEDEPNPKPPGPRGPKPRNTKKMKSFDKEDLIFTQLADPNAKSEILVDENFTAKKLNMKRVKAKTIKKFKESPTSNRKRPSPDGINNKVSTGTHGRGDQNVTKIEIMAQNDEEHSEYRDEIADKFSILRASLEMVVKKLEGDGVEGVHLDQFINSQSDDSCFYAALVKQFETYHSWSFIQFNPPLRRMIYIMRLIYGPYKFYFLEIESKVNEDGTFNEAYPCFMLYKKSCNNIDETEIWALIKAMTEYKCRGMKGNWFDADPTKATPDIIKVSINHRLHKSIPTGVETKKRIRLPAEESVLRLYKYITTKIDIAILEINRDSGKTG